MSVQEGASFSSPWCGVVVHDPAYCVIDNETAQMTQHENAARIARKIDFLCESIDPKPRLIVPPELCLTGARRFLVDAPMETIAVELPGESVFGPILDACRRNNCYFASTAQEKLAAIPGHFFHTGFVFGPDGLVQRSPKSQA